MPANPNFGAVNLGSREFQEFRDYLRQISGIDLGDNKKYLVATRVRRVLIDNHFSSLDELTQNIKQPSNTSLRQKVIDVMTTNETFWFRDGYPFDYLKHALLPEFESRASSVRIWSAACSSGQEPYSISMIINEFTKEKMLRATGAFEIVATDLSSEILDQARQGVYDQLSVSRGLSEDRKRAYFERQSDGSWKAKPMLGQRISFRPLNLQENYSSLGKFDIIFCRNVLIYFSAELKTDILKRMHACLRPGGYLILGSSEGLAGAGSLYSMIHCNPGVIYRAKSV